ncbi:MAG TPA: ISKra4 family transposase [Armatimonadetes bacterium]|nr:ISKra4 family transposase [Armatimonadota bacterium]
MTTDTSQNSLLEAAKSFAINHLNTADITTAEDEIQNIVRAIAGTMMQEVAAKMSGKPTYRGVRIPCECGREAEFKGYRKRWIKTLHREISIKRSYYRCRQCGRTYTPWDKEQGLSERIWTPRIKDLVATTSAVLPYKTALSLVKRTTGLIIEESSGEEIVKDMGNILRKEEGEKIKAAVDSGEEIKGSGYTGRLYISIDAAKAHTDGDWHDIKTAIIYEGKRTAGSTEDTIANPKYTAAQEKSEDFGRRIYTKALQAGYDSASERIILADGGEWIWNEARNHFPKSTKILDYYHASEHIYRLAAILYGESNPKGARWAKEHSKRLKERGPGSLLRAIKRRKARSEQEKEALRLEAGYFKKYRKYMNYPKYRAQGMMIGSGQVESACKIIVGQRLKQSGMRWTKSSADVVLAVRCALLSGEYD